MSRNQPGVSPETSPTAGPNQRRTNPPRPPPGGAKSKKKVGPFQSDTATRYKLGRLTADDEDGYHRVQCPAAAGKVRCPLRPPSMSLDRDRPEILQPPEHPQACCTQQTITVPAGVLAKTAQKHDYPSAAWRRSYARRTAASASSPPSRTPPPATLPAAGAASPAWPRSCCSPRRCSPSATSGSSRHGTHARKKAPAAPPRDCPRKPAGAAARYPPRHPPDAPARPTATPTSTTRAARACPHTPGTSPEQQKKGAYGAPNQPGQARNHAPTGTSDPNVKMDLTET